MQFLKKKVENGHCFLETRPTIHLCYKRNQGAVASLAAISKQKIYKGELIMKYEFDPNDVFTNVNDNTFFCSFANVRDRIGEIGVKTMQIIGSEGISEEQEQIKQTIEVLLFSNGIPMSQSSIRRTIETLKTVGLLKAHEINTGTRRFNINEFTTEVVLFFHHYFRHCFTDYLLIVIQFNNCFSFSPCIYENTDL